MKKVLIWMIAILIMAGLTGCGNSENAKSETKDGKSANPTIAENENMNDYISLTSQIAELESGLSAVRYDGDYAFDLFLEQGGRGHRSGRVSVYKPIIA